MGLTNRVNAMVRLQTLGEKKSGEDTLFYFNCTGPADYEHAMSGSLGTA